MSSERGVLWVTVPGGRVALAVADGTVTKARPPYLGRWAVGKSLHWVDLRHPDAVWQVDVEMFAYQLRGDAKTVRRWQHPRHHISKECDLFLGRVKDRWWVAQTGQGGVGWIYPDLGGALAEVRVRLDPPDGWGRVPANFDSSGKPLPETDVPELGELDAAWLLT